MTTTTNMNLDLPDVNSTPDPTWSTKIVTAFDVVDSHDHASGSGVKITPNGLNINDDLPFSNNNATQLRSSRFQNQNSTLADAADLTCSYFVNGDFYINNSSGTSVQITSGSGLNFATVGTIGGDYGQPGVDASVTYNDSTKIYTFLSDAGVFGKMNQGPTTIVNQAGTQGVTFTVPTSVTPYTVTFPGAAASSNSILKITSSGTVSYVPFNNITDPVTINANVTMGANASVTGTLTPTGGFVTNGTSVNLKIATYTGFISTGTISFTVSGATILYSVTGRWSGGGQRGGIRNETGANIFFTTSAVSANQFDLTSVAAANITYYIVVLYI